MSRRLTRKRRDVDPSTIGKILAFIDAFKEANDGSSPSLCEIRHAVGLASASEASRYLEEMRDRESLRLIKFSKGKKRLIERNHANIARWRAGQMLVAAS